MGKESKEGKEEFDSFSIKKLEEETETVSETRCTSCHLLSFLISSCFSSNAFSSFLSFVCLSLSSCLHTVYPTPLCICYTRELRGDRNDVERKRKKKSGLNWTSPAAASIFPSSSSWWSVSCLSFSSFCVHSSERGKEGKNFWRLNFSLFSSSSLSLSLLLWNDFFFSILFFPPDSWEQNRLNPSTLFSLFQASISFLRQQQETVCRTTTITTDNFDATYDALFMLDFILTITSQSTMMLIFLLLLLFLMLKLMCTFLSSLLLLFYLYSTSLLFLLKSITSLWKMHQRERCQDMYCFSFHLLSSASSREFPGGKTFQ